MSEQKKAIIIGAGPAGLTAGLEFLRRSDIQPVLLEASADIGGISRTVKYKGYRMDIGGHRFFSKSDRVMQWWLDLMPPEDTADSEAVAISYQGQTRSVTVPITAAQEPPLRGMGPLQSIASIETDTDETDPRTNRTLPNTATLRQS